MRAWAAFRLQPRGEDGKANFYGHDGINQVSLKTTYRLKLGALRYAPVRARDGTPMRGADTCRWVSTSSRSDGYGAGDQP